MISILFSSRATLNVTFKFFTANFTARTSGIHEGHHRMMRVQPMQEPNRLGDAREQEKRDYRGGEQDPFVCNSNHYSSRS